MTTETQAILEGARKSGDDNVALRALARLEKQVELLGRVAGITQAGGSINVAVGVGMSVQTERVHQVISDVEAFQQLIADLGTSGAIRCPGCEARELGLAKVIDAEVIEDAEILPLELASSALPVPQ